MSMFTVRNKGRLALGAVVVGASLALSGCASGDPLETGTDESASGDTIVVGSQAYPSNELIAEIYAQALEAEGLTVERKFNIGQRDAYLPSLENGEVDLFPEYTGNLLQYYVPETAAGTADDIYAALVEALPEGLTVLEQSSATDQDSYNVTSAFAEEYDLSSIGDLANVDVPIVVGGNAELADRPYGASGLLDSYAVTATFSATGDTTLEALLAGSVNVANIYTADPRIETENLVTLEDTEGIFLASNVVPLVGADVADPVADIINAVSAALTPEGLVALNLAYTVEQGSLEDVAAEWLAENGFTS